MDLNQIISNLNFSSVFWQVIASLIFMVGDYVSGFIQAVINNNVDSKIMREGLFRKILLVLVILLSFIFQYAFNIPIISKVVCIYIIIMEIVSILENLKKAGVDLGKLGELLKIKSENDTIDVNIKNIENKEENEK